MSKIHRVSAGRVTADFFTNSYRLSASVMVYKRRLIDVLGDRMTDYLELVDVYVSRINSPGDIIATHQKGSLVKREIILIMLSSETEGTSKERFYTGRHHLPTFVGTPSFEIEGNIQWGQPELEVKKLMATDTQQFLPILDATATNAHFPKVTYQGPLVLVNKPKIEIICGRIAQ